MKWSLKYVCEIDWYDLESGRDREFVEDSKYQPFVIRLLNVYIGMIIMILPKIIGVYI